MSYVYIMNNSKNPAIIKVGYSNDPDRRVNELNRSHYGIDFGCGDWQIYTKFMSSPDMEARRLEHEAHIVLAAYRVKTQAHTDRELFACPAEKAKQILTDRSFLFEQHRTRGNATYRTKTSRPISTQHAIGIITCPMTGDEYYYACQKRFNFRTKVTEDLSVSEWKEAEKLYKSYHTKQYGYWNKNVLYQFLVKMFRKK